MFCQTKPYILLSKKIYITNQKHIYCYIDYLYSLIINQRSLLVNYDIKKQSLLTKSTHPSATIIVFGCIWS